ncbi:MAG: hypothetical protein OXI30_10395 [Chloroflexota bacterium]|nr:hypothetical protein [Chloroflexota bacterium]
MTESILLLDPRIVASTAKAKLKLGAITKQPANPLFSEEGCARPPKPWEARLDNVYPNVIYDDEDGLFKCWYKSFIYDGLSNRTPLTQRPQQSYGESEREEGLLYATSVDGIHWRKPELGIIDFEGSKANNLVMRRATHGLHAGGVLKDARDPDPARRYKFIHRNASARKMASCFSLDGLHWSQPILWPAHDAIGDCHNNAIWSSALERYVCITRGWADGIRTVLRSESEDFIHWTKPFEIMRGLDAHDQIYSMPICLYGDLYIGLPSLFHKGDASAADWDTVDTELAISVDSVNWRRICRRQSLIPRGEGEYPDGDYDCGCVYAAAPFVHDDKILIYYGGGNGRHNDWREGSLNLATLDLDRWAGYTPRATHDAAILETTALQLSGERLTLNAELGRGGWIRYALLDGGGAALAGFGFDDCLPVKQGGASCELRWRKSDIAMLKGRAARVAFNFQRATLYALNAARLPASG